jgi:hypothetical protein
MLDLQELRAEVMRLRLENSRLRRGKPASAEDGPSTGAVGSVAVGDFVVPGPLRYLADEMAASRQMLDLSDDWDGEGSPGYAEATWQRAVTFLLAGATQLWGDQGIVVAAPEILPGPNGSVDLHWRTPDRELLVNVPADVDAPARYYGDHGGGLHPIEGTLDVSAVNHWLLMWLTE